MMEGKPSDAAPATIPAEPVKKVLREIDIHDPQFQLRLTADFMLSGAFRYVN